MKALCLGGGAFRGYYQIPVLKHLLSVHDYDYVYGVSIGAVNGSMVAQDKFDMLCEMWENIDNRKDALKLKWWWPFAGLYSLDPLRKKLDEYVELNDFKIPFSAGVVSLTDGKYYQLSSKDMKDSEQLRDAIQASASISGYMTTPIIDINGEPHLGADGGFRNYIPIPPVKTFTHIDVVVCWPTQTIVPRYDLNGNAFKLKARTVEVMEDEVFQRDLEQIRGKCHESTEITLYAPPKDTGPSFEINKELKKLRWDMGLEALKNPIKI